MQSELSQRGFGFIGLALFTVVIFGVLMIPEALADSKSAEISQAQRAVASEMKTGQLSGVSAYSGLASFCEFSDAHQYEGARGSSKTGKRNAGAWSTNQ